MTSPRRAPYNLTSITFDAAVHCYDTLRWITDLNFAEMNLRPAHPSDAEIKVYVPLDMEDWKKGHVKLWERPDNISRTVLTLDISQEHSIAQAVRCFNAAAAYADVMDIFVPFEFRNPDVQLHIDPMFHLVADVDSVREEDVRRRRSSKVSCAYQVWKRCDKSQRDADKLPSRPDFIFCDRSEADLAVGRDGGISSPALSSDDKDIFVQAKNVSVCTVRSAFLCMDEGNFCYREHNRQISERRIAHAYVDHYLRTKGFTSPPCGL